MIEVIRWITLGLSVFALGFSVFTYCTILRQNKRLHEEKWELMEKYAAVKRELIRLQNELKNKG